MMEVMSGFLVGIVGSLHCAGMCGPLVLALPLTRSERMSIAWQSFIYNSGRVVVYGILGLLLGVIGWGIQISGFQKILSIAIGVIMIITALKAWLPSFNISRYSIGQKFSAYSNQVIKKLFTINNNFSALRIGMINGLLPCGLVYVALASSVTLASPLKSMSYMLLFGIGTMPMMLAIMIGGRMFKGVARKLKFLLPIFTVLLGIYLIMRGLSLHVADNPQDILDGIVKMSCH